VRQLGGESASGMEKKELYELKFIQKGKLDIWNN